MADSEKPTQAVSFQEDADSPHDVQEAEDVEISIVSDQDDVVMVCPDHGSPQKLANANSLVLPTCKCSRSTHRIPSMENISDYADRCDMDENCISTNQYTRESFRIDPKDSFSTRQRKFYEAQNDTLDVFHRIDILATNEGTDERPLTQVEGNDDSSTAKLLIKLSFAANIILFVLKLYIAVLSGSLAVIASVLDSALDLLSGAILYVVDLIASKQDLTNYPVGKARMEPLGIVVFSCVMATASLQLIIYSIQTLLSGDPGLVLDNIVIFILGVVVVVKGVLLFFCSRVNSPAVQALAADHRNDVMSNIFGAICAYVGSEYWWPFDSIGAIIISIVIISIWTGTAYEQIKNLTGIAASPEFHTYLTYLAATHHHSILKIETLRAFYLGYRVMVECDIVLPPDMPVSESHNIGETLQMKFERLKEVERAFVHIDVDSDHKLEHKVV